MAYKYLYIDDTSADYAEGTINGLESYQLSIIFENPTGDWDTQIDKLLENIPNIDGLILDLRLNEEQNVEGKFSKYRGNTLAQELRTLVKERKIKDLPIILYSAERNIQFSFDLTSNDLFDICVSKESLQDKQFEILSNRLLALSSGYEQLNKYYDGVVKPTLEDVLALSTNEIDRLDLRLQTQLKGLWEQTPHYFSHYFIKQILMKPGVLIPEKILAARLGVNITESKDWDKFLEIIKACSYQGIFCKGWQGWWMFKIADWWKEYFSSNLLERMNADERVSIINAKYTLELIPARPINKAKSNVFWTVCKGLEAPLDPMEGLLVVGQEKLYPWQDREFISFEEALTRKNIHKWHQISPTEASKFEVIKKLFSRERNEG